MGIVDAMRRLSGRPYSGETEPKSPRSPQATWRDTDPGYNPNMAKTGRSYYDTVENKKASPGIWDYHLQSEKAEREASHDVARAAFKSMGASTTPQGDVLDASALRKMFASDRVDQLMAMADKNKDGKIDFKEFCDLIRKYPCD
ncbi:hypothetical protein COHA_005514 [Chlorella ohadii]|uniref:EF-hand domain-containing protein n=1 Tax=Chlorella ohadii TaxID=2649997 RepID=A0AAD5DPM0_9CHLO|nr:hypothetical protein COHA_005514 [Chlorella ohadii]